MTTDTTPDRHSQAFWDLMARYPRTERARGYLEGYEAVHGPGASETDGLRSVTSPALNEETGVG